ncbi:hypothetical protein ACO2Q8_24330 [Larkinella sp. VNQ87]|uniref:hypothetical protein n=1 Tax=Larkinella sp. VNQ87 TaxID=3400921 RepID=UPI003C0E186F
MNLFTLRASLLFVFGMALACKTPKSEPVTPGGSGSTAGKKPVVTITTPFGSDTKAGFVDGNGKAAQFSYPCQMTFDRHDNLYVIDQRASYIGGSVIRKVDPAGNVTTFAKGLGSITDLCVDPRDGLTLYAIESGDALGTPNGIFRISSNGQVTRLSGGPDPDGGYSWGFRDGPLDKAKFYQPQGIEMDKAGNLYIGDQLNQRIRKVNLATNTVSTLAGGQVEQKFCDYVDGKGLAARFCTAEDLELDEAGNLFVPDWGNHSVRKITPDGTVSTFLPLSTAYAPEGPRSQTGVYQPYRVEYNAVNKQLFVVVDTGNGLKLVTADDYLFDLGRHIVSTDFADKSPGAKHPITGMAVNKKGELFILDKFNHCIRKVSISWK